MALAFKWLALTSGCPGNLSRHSLSRGLVKLPHAAKWKPRHSNAELPTPFLLDGCSMNLPFGPLSGRLRANSPGSKFRPFFPPIESCESEMMLLFHWGIDGFVTLHKRWRLNFQKRPSLYSGAGFGCLRKCCCIREQMKTLLDRQLLRSNH